MNTATRRRRRTPGLPKLGDICAARIDGRVVVGVVASLRNNGGNVHEVGIGDLRVIQPEGEDWNIVFREMVRPSVRELEGASFANEDECRDALRPYLRPDWKRIQDEERRKREVTS